MAGRGGPARPNGPVAGNKICQFKLVLLGESAVGKSSLVLRFVKGQFQEFQESTIGAAFLTQTVCLGDTTVKFEIWDTAGQERYHSLAPMYYRGAQAAIVVYDITNTDTFTRAKNWVKELQRQASPNIVIALAGNKADITNKRVVDHQDGNAPIHRARVVTEWFDEHENDVNRMPWPSQSTDLNPIQHLWEILERCMRQRFPSSTEHQIMEFIVEELCHSPPVKF